MRLGQDHQSFMLYLSIQKRNMEAWHYRLHNLFFVLLGIKYRYTYLYIPGFIYSCAMFDSYTVVFLLLFFYRLVQETTFIGKGLQKLFLIHANGIWTRTTNA